MRAWTSGWATKRLLACGILATVLAAPAWGAQADDPQIPAAPSQLPGDATRILSCELTFPLDSVKFSEKQIDACFQNVRRDALSYIHVIATATPPGSLHHNLYLSTRRAGAIEGYLKNRFPDVEIHAFGGGENERFGKKARIFIVEGGRGPLATASVQTIVPVIKEVPGKTREITKIRPEPNLGVLPRLSVGFAALHADQTPFQRLEAAAGYDIGSQGLGWLPTGTSRLTSGLVYTLDRTNLTRDIHGLSGYAEAAQRAFDLWGQPVVFGAGVQAGTAAARRPTLDWAGRLMCGWGRNRHRVRIDIGYGRLAAWASLGAEVAL